MTDLAPPREAPAGDPEPSLAAQLLELWAELARRHAVVNQVPLDSHPDVLRARIEHEARRVRALRERP